MSTIERIAIEKELEIDGLREEITRLKAQLACCDTKNVFSEVKKTQLAYEEVMQGTLELIEEEF